MHFDFLGFEIMLDDFYRNLVAKRFTAKNVQVAAAVFIHEMTANIRGLN
jgi:hypothetical protein